jgi:hypothetical protein
MHIQGSPYCIGTTGRHAFAHISKHLPQIVVPNISIVQKIVMADVAKILRILHSDAHWITMISSEAKCPSGRNLVLHHCRTKKRQGIVPENVWFDQCMPGVNNANESLYIRAPSFLGGPTHPLQSYVFIAVIQSTRFAPIQLD